MDIVAQRSWQEADVIGRIEECIAAASHTPQEVIAVLALEMPGLARLRAHPGGIQGERLIRELHQRIIQTLRPDDRVEFFNDTQCLITLPRLKNPGHARLAVRRLLHELHHFRDEQGLSVQVAPLLGVALWPEAAASGAELVSKAWLAVDMAKHNHQDFHFYAPQGSHPNLFSWDIAHEVERALRNDEFSMHYQPQVAIADNRVTGMEALLRWYHPEYGLISPATFIPQAEHSSAIQSLTRWCLHTALRQYQELPPVSRSLTVSVNISSRNLADHGFGDMIANAIDLWSMPASQLTLEITEGALLEDIHHAISVLNALRQMGVRISIDDFGTGYSSLSYLKQLPIDELKIDQSFVRNILTDDQDRKIAGTIIKIAKDFGFSVVAEGIENHGALQLLVEMGCDIGQGFIISRPLSHEDFQRWLAEGQVRH